MLVNKGLVVTAGFVFWLIAARFYPVDQVGLATAIIAGSTLIVGFSTFGFEISLIRFLKSYDRSKAFYTCLFVITGSSFALSILYIIFVRYLSPGLSFIQQPLYAAVFVLFTVISSVGLITSNTFIALRDAKYSFIQNLLLVSRLPALVPLAFLGSLGILGANFVGYILAYAIVFVFLARFIPFKPRPDKEFIKKSFSFSFGNYIANILYSAAFQALPIIILTRMGETAAGIYFIAFNVGNFLLQVPIALSTSFFVEGVYGENMRRNIVRSAAATILLLVPGIVLFWVFGADILRLFGESYVTADAISLLRLVALSSLVYVAYSLFQPVLNIKMRVKFLILLNFVILVLLAGTTYLLTPWTGILSVGYALIVTFLIVDLVILYLAVRWGWLTAGNEGISGMADRVKNYWDHMMDAAK